MMLLGGLTAIGLWALGVPYWLTFGIFTGVVAIVPFFGSLVSTLLPAAFVLGEGGPGRALAIVLLRERAARHAARSVLESDEGEAVAVAA